MLMQDLFINSSEDSIKWYNKLDCNQKIYLKEISFTLCGIQWKDFNILFSPRERLNILYDKLILENIVKI